MLFKFFPFYFVLLAKQQRPRESFDMEIKIKLKKKTSSFQSRL